jgi:uncharacterized protein (TIGR02611 family)
VIRRPLAEAPERAEIAGRDLVSMKPWLNTCLRSLEHPRWRIVRRVVVALVGGGVLFVGIALLVLPGPAFLVIPLGLAILATEFYWARRWLKWAKAKFEKRNKP